MNLSAQTGNIVINNATTGINLTGIVTATNFENFTITTGSGNDTFNQSGLVNNIIVKSKDYFTTGAGNDTINTGLGDSDFADGGAGDDLLIVDYSIGDTGRGMTLSTGVATEGFQGVAYRLNAAGNATLDRVDFSGINRFQVTGTSQNDNINTASGNDTINSGAGDDNIDAGAGDDNIDGVNGASLTPGLGEIDSLTGGTGSDRFILGNATKVYYDDANTLTNGSSDYANINDFNIANGDIIQLQGTSSNYLLAVVGADTQILINKPNTEPDELIGIVRNQTGLSLTGTYFSYVFDNTPPTNQAPTNITLNNSTIAENQPINTKIGNFTTIDPDAGNTFTYTLVSGTGDTDNNVFTITNNELKTKAVFDYETKNSYSIRVKTTDQGGLSYEKQLTIGVSNVNEPPVITTPITFSIPENAKSVGKINAEDPEKDAITFALAGINASLLAINPTTGELSFKTAPDFEKPLDNEKKNLYKTQVEVKDANNNQAIQDIIITVTNVNETPIAIDDQLSIIQGSFGTINPLINDSDPDGDTLEITSKTDGKYGKVNINGNNLTYTLLDAKYTGKDVFNYTTSDKNGLESTARVNVTIADKNITKETSQVTSVNPDNSLFPKEAGTQTGIVDKVSYSFSTNYNQSTGKQTLENTLKQTSAVFTNLFGLYEIDDATGAVNGILPGQSGYAKAALSKVVSNFVVRAGGSGNGVTGDVIVSGDKTYAPFVIANGGKSSGNIQEAINAFFGANPNNSAATAQDYTSLPVAYFSFGAANPDGAAHIKSLGNNIFGFEDLPAGVGVSDYDFNDIVFSFGF